MMIDEKSPVFTNNSVIDVTIVNETSYDYDEMKGVVSDWANPYDLTKPVEVFIPEKPKSAMEALGSKCKACTSTTLLSIRRKKEWQNDRNLKQIKQLVEDMVSRGEDPSHEFCIICHNCIRYLKRIREVRKSSGLDEFSIEDLEKVFKK